MTHPRSHTPGRPVQPLAAAARLGREKILTPDNLEQDGGISPDRPVLVTLAAGKGTRFGDQPKCAQRVGGVPLARHTIDAFWSLGPSPVICVVGHRKDEVMAALGAENVYVASANPTGGTAFAAFEAFSVGELLDENPLLVIGMGDRIATASVLRELYRTHAGGGREADLTFLTAHYEPPRYRGKGRILRDPDGTVRKILEQKDIDAVEDPAEREALDDLREGNCPLYVVRARTLYRHLCDLTNDNAQGQYYLTDLVAILRAQGGELRTVTVTPGHSEYVLLCADVTRPADLAVLEQKLPPSKADVVAAARAIRSHRPAGQVGAIGAQLTELYREAAEGTLLFQADQPVAVGISGGRLRIAFMHPDMGRFLGPAWQMPIGAKDASGREQIVILAQPGADDRIHLYPLNPAFRETRNSVAAGAACMYPGPEVSDWYGYEAFGTRMAETLLASLGYVTDAELARLRDAGAAIPPSQRRVSANLRRPFSLVGNAIASLRTLRSGPAGARVQGALGAGAFRGLRLVTDGAIPQGGFSSSSAVTVATLNTLNALYRLGLVPDDLVYLACQAEYGTGVRAGSLDQATEQKGRAGQGTLISSNPKDHYRVIGTSPVPADRIRVLFPFSVDRDTETWRWSAGMYGEGSSSARPTTSEIRKLTGKAAELAAILTRLPVRVDWFQEIEADLVGTGRLTPANGRRVGKFLRAIPLLISREDLRRCVLANQAWYVDQLMRAGRLGEEAARGKAEQAFASLFAEWREPVLHGVVGIPLRAMVAYLFGEVAKNFHLIHHPEEWIACVARSQRGDRCFDIDPALLPPREELLRRLPWEEGLTGPALMEAWLTNLGATPFDYNAGLDDASLSRPGPFEPHRWDGTNFFRGLALIDLIEAMLVRAFGCEAVAVRVNAAGQGDFFQVHVDTRQADVEAVKGFIRAAVYARFDLRPPQEFVEPHPGGGAVGVRLDRFDRLPDLIALLSALSPA